MVQGEAHLNPLHALASILVVCDGNHCRSPIAEALLGQALGRDRTVGSAGLTALVGAPPDPEAVRLMAARGFDLSAHRGRQLTVGLALATELILVMETRQKDACERLLPSLRGRVFLLGHWLEGPAREIPDPYLRGRDAFQAALDHLDRGVASWAQRLRA
jgi:protein-tyrosine phosphatase